MKDNAKCFVLINSIYEEITYSELNRRRKTDPAYAKRWFVPLQGTLMEVSHIEYKRFYKTVERRKYLKKESKRVEEVSLDALDTAEMIGKDIVIDPSPPLDEFVLDKLLLEKLNSGFETLDSQNQRLLKAIYYDGKTESKIAEDLGISQQAVSKRHMKILRQLRKIMKI